MKLWTLLKPDTKLDSLSTKQWQDVSCIWSLTVIPLTVMLDWLPRQGSLYRLAVDGTARVRGSTASTYAILNSAYRLDALLHFARKNSNGKRAQIVVREAVEGASGWCVNVRHRPVLCNRLTTPI